MPNRFALLAALGVAACAVRSPVPELAHYDFGQAVALTAQSSAFNLRSVEVVSPTWLDGPAIQYRLLYADPAQRLSYRESRWVASPGELVEQSMRRAIVSNESMALSGGCKLRIDLDEFVHAFETPDSSYGLIELRAVLLAPKDDMLLARRAFSVRRPAASHDAHGAVSALGNGVGQLTVALLEWLATLDHEVAPGLNIARICRGR